MKFLASRNMSLFCFFLNCIFAFMAYGQNNILWFILSGAFAILCLYNYNNAEG